jgi:hypothetical protein
VVCNSRFLILPQVHVANPASRVLSLCMDRPANNWMGRWQRPNATCACRLMRRDKQKTLFLDFAGTSFLETLFQTTRISTHHKEEAHMTAISDKYAQLGGAAGFLGPQITAEVPAANGGLKQDFRNGTIYWHSRTGAFEVHGAIRGRWLALGGHE